MQEKQIIAGNVIALIGCIFMVFVGYAKDNKTTIIMQTIQIFFLGMSSLVLGSIPAVISNWGAIPRNFIVLHKKYTMPVKIVYTIAITAFAVYANNVGWIGALPILATFIFCLALDTPNKKQLKLIIMGTLIMWFIHDVFIQSYTSAVFDVLTFISSVAGYFRKNEEEKASERT